MKKRKGDGDSQPQRAADGVLSRRALLKHTGAWTAASLGVGLPACSSDDGEPGDEEPEPETDVCGVEEYEGDLGPEDLFQHGVASGDPLSDAVILWTRVTTADDADVDVVWEISSSADFSDCVAHGTVTTNADRDFTVKDDAGMRVREAMGMARLDWRGW
jgi:hypothetical protein